METFLLSLVLVHNLDRKNSFTHKLIFISQCLFSFAFYLKNFTNIQNSSLTGCFCFYPKVITQTLVKKGRRGEEGTGEWRNLLELGVSKFALSMKLFWIDHIREDKMHEK